MLAQVERTASSVEASVAVYKNLIGDKERSGNELTNAVNGAENALHALLQEFRDENKIARGATLTPAYFNTWPKLREQKMPDFGTSDDEKNLLHQQQLLATFHSEIQDIRARIQAAFNKRFDALQTLDMHFLSAATLPNNGDTAGVTSITPQGAN